jgi:hypothetical protein
MNSDRTTTFSPCRKYRFTLWREWDKSNPSYCQFIGLNPSTADEFQDDPTVRRCINFAKSWGYGALCMTNIFAYRATDPEVMKAQTLPLTEREENIHWLIRIGREASIRIAAWGKHGRHQFRAAVVKTTFFEAGLTLHCLRTNKDGSPEHPLYLSGELKPVRYHPLNL